MLAVNHVVVGAVGWLAVGPYLTGPMDAAELTVSTLVAAGAALAPDLDHPGSTVSRKFGPVSRVASVGVAAAAGGHRMLTHSLVFVALVGVGTWAAVAVWAEQAAGIIAALSVALSLPLLARRAPVFISGATGVAFAAGLWWAITAGLIGYSWTVPAVTLGVLLHAVPGDLLTPSGVPLLAPFSRRRFAIGLFRTGSPVEGLVGTALSVVGVWLFIVGVRDLPSGFTL